ncbi:MAG: magnesium chelatase subunit H [Deltaproteobacteria bacterium]|nr:magnesium chelatase subunit H [Deltaproteobacteria bacterium]
MADMNLCIVAVGASSIIEIEKNVSAWKSGPWAERIAVTTHYVGSDMFSEDAWPPIFQSIYKSQFVLLDTMGVPDAFSQALSDGLGEYQGHVAVVNATTVGVRSLTRVGRFSLKMMQRMSAGKTGQDGTQMARMTRLISWMEKIGRTLPVGRLRDMRNFLWICRYWLYGTSHNLENMLWLIGREYFGCKEFPQPEPPAVIDDCSIMDPASRRVFKNVKKYYQAFPPSQTKPGLGLLFRTRTYPLDTHPVMARVLARLSDFFNVIPVALDSTLGRDFKKLRELLMPGGVPLVDVLVNPESFRLSQGPMGGDADWGEQFLRDLNVPVLHPFFLTKRTRAQWDADDKGAEVGEFLISVFLPELDGCIEMYPIGAVGTPQEQTPELAPLEDRVERLVLRACNWSALRRTPNRDKRLAIIFYDYPPGEESVGSASFLDTFASLAALLEKLAAEGYDLQPLSAEELRAAFVEQGRNNAADRHTIKDDAAVMLDAGVYRSLTSSLPGLQRIEKCWGSFPGPVMNDGKRVWLPGIRCGKVFIGLQPPRGCADEQPGGYHDKHMSPHHQYAAFYRWLELDFKADAVMHVGTHGTLEFLPGKEKAMSERCFPDALIGALPHLYVYYSGNPSEAMIAKRRAHAVLIGHLPAPFVKGGLYDELQELKQLVDEYAGAQSLNPGRCSVILEEIRQRVEALGWQWIDFDDLHRRLHDMKMALIPARLHTLGTGFSEEEAVAYLADFFRSSGPDVSGLYALLARQQGWDWEKLCAQPHRNEQQWEQLDNLARQWIVNHIVQGRPIERGIAVDSAATGEIVRRGEAIVKALVHNGELDAVVRGLGGEYIPCGLSGDLLRSPEILPTGRNLVQFDPRLVPSSSALRQGERIAAETIEHYVKEHGSVPGSIAMVLWGLETSQTQGETVGQILGCLGVRVKRIAGQWDPVLELISLEQLGRPRIDVTVQICGFFRDMFPNTLELLQNAIAMVGFADEPDAMNSVRVNSRRLFASLSEQGLPEEEAREFALARLFGPASAEYGTGVEQIVKDRAWQSETELVTAYVESLKHAYTPNHHGREMGDLLTDNLRHVDVVSQVRSSRDYEMTDLDHYYEFFGGLSRSVEQASGKKAMMLVSDTHEGRVRTEDVKDAIQRGVHTRLVNPVWLEGMLAHSHHGGHEIAKRMENLIGLAATTGAVGQADFECVNLRLVFDDAMRERIQANNPHAMLDIVKRLWEAYSRGYWSPDEETLDRLKQIYLGVEDHVEGIQA